MGLVKFFHHLLNPHCPDCAHEKECKNCDTLRELLDSERYENKKLLETLLSITNPSKEKEEVKEVNFEEIRPRHVPWRVIQEMKEREDRKKAQVLRENQKTEELEKELLEKSHASKERETIPIHANDGA